MKNKLIKIGLGVFLVTTLLLTACSETQEYIDQDNTESVPNAAPEGQTTPEGQTAQQEQTGSQEQTTQTGQIIQQKQVSQVLSELEWENKTVYLTEVKNKLEEAGISYRGTYNRSRERVDMTLSDGTKLIFLGTEIWQEERPEYELMMCGDRFNEKGFRAFKPETGTQTELSIARNEIYARHGRIFQDPFLQAVFEQNTWYKPLYDGEAFAQKQSQLLSKAEQEKIHAILKQEQDHGYRLPDGADYRLPECIVSGSRIDIDGDGETEQITYEAYEKYSAEGAPEEYSLTVNGQEVFGTGVNLYPNLYIANLAGEQIQLLAATAGPSADYEMDVYSFEDGKLKANGTVPGDPETTYLYGTRFSTTSQHDFFQTFPTREIYKLQNGSIVRMDQEWYEFGNKAKAIAEIPLYQNQGGGTLGITLLPGDEVIILGTDYKEWVGIEKRSTGETGWVKCRREENGGGYTCILPDGREAASSELFEGLIFYG